MFYSLLRPLLFCFEAETAHTLALNALRLSEAIKLLACLTPKKVEDPVKVMGLTFPNRVGLAAGLDKNGAYLDALSRLGFGFLEVGTVTPLPQPGNCRPRLFRLDEHAAIINRMGFNNDGVDACLSRIKARRQPSILGINIGKNAATPHANATSDYLVCFDKVYPYASYVAINISSPNTKGLRQLQETDALAPLLMQLKKRQAQLADRYGHYVPLVVKIAPDLADQEIKAIAKHLLAHQVDGVIATNTTLARSGIQKHKRASETGGLSGAPLRECATHVIRVLAAELDKALPIIGVGGILSAQDAQEKLAAGAELVQLYSGLIFRGPRLVRECATALATQAE